ncbi:MAG: hypothetical protein UX13_C0024G0005 [Candidatus Woesebacteria bacterium GW2011_GWB1_45_5]|uniref:Uncharacterized protein n=1 Tax=Candidatus Woesebacteria bacterium GW2011_GWB1_45_5 TaxID=1618581 RepID=A0A0G1PX06_9BACT|nr:MAG: hypothetical protein UX13_C0024G0005 [Candidatus Woesebacteria bacterium GW2011_GWB1_45_5]
MRRVVEGQVDLFSHGVPPTASLYDKSELQKIAVKLKTERAKKLWGTQSRQHEKIAKGIERKKLAKLKRDLRNQSMVRK